MSKPQIQTIQPVYGENYTRGDVGFTWHQGGDLVDRTLSCGIAWFTSFERLGDIKVSHVFKVLGPDEQIGATAKGVIREPLLPLFNDPNVLVFFRRPRIFNHDLIERTIAEDLKHEGKKYDYTLFIADAIGGSRLGRLLGLDPLVTKLFDSSRKLICSEYIGGDMKKQPEYDGIGIMKLPARRIRPQGFFECDATFRPWKVTRYANA